MNAAGVHNLSHLDLYFARPRKYFKKSKEESRVGRKSRSEWECTRHTRADFREMKNLNKRRCSYIKIENRVCVAAFENQAAKPISEEIGHWHPHNSKSSNT
jgi:hypothetical protein